MRKLLALIVVGISTVFAAPAMAADMPYYPDIEVPDVDYGLEGGFYLRGSLAGNFSWARDFDIICCSPGPYDFEKAGWGYSFGAGIGYEFGDGLRADVTVDYLHNSGLSSTNPPVDYTLRAGVALANAYYDYGLGDGFGAYVGAGLGMAYYEISDAGGSPDPTGTGVTGVGAVMAGVSYDLGSAVADLGYRGLYMPVLTNSYVTDPIFVHDAFIHELRGTVRYRFN